jgi:hypothetical protein
MNPEIDALRKNTWAALRSLGVPSGMIFSWVGVDAAWRASRHHPADPWMRRSSEFARASVEAAQEGRPDSAEEFGKMATWAGWAACSREDEAPRSLEAWLAVLRAAQKLVRIQCRLLDESLASASKTDDSEAVAEPVRVTKAWGQKPWDKSYVAELARTADYVAKDLAGIATKVEGLVANEESLDLTLDRAASLAAEAFSRAGKLVDRTRILPWYPGMDWPSLVSEAARVRLGANTGIRTVPLLRALNLAANHAALCRVHVQHDATRINEMVANKPANPRGVAAETVDAGEQGLEGLVRQVADHLADLIRDLWAAELASQAVIGVVVPATVQIEAEWNLGMINDHNGPAIREGEDALRRFAVM